MNKNSVMLLRSACHYLLQALEVLNMLEEDTEYREFVMKCRAKPKQLRHIGINAERGSLWLTLFFILETIDQIADEPPR